MIDFEIVTVQTMGATQTHISHNGIVRAVISYDKFRGMRTATPSPTPWHIHFTNPRIDGARVWAPKRLENGLDVASLDEAIATATREMQGFV